MTTRARADTDRQASQQFRARRRAAVFWCCTAGVIIPIAGFHWWFFGSIPVGLRFIRGERVILEPTRLRGVGSPWINRSGYRHVFETTRRGPCGYLGRTPGVRA